MAGPVVETCGRERSRPASARAIRALIADFRKYRFTGGRCASIPVNAGVKVDYLAYAITGAG